MVNRQSLIEFWKGLSNESVFHPSDRETIDHHRHDFQNDVMPGPWFFNLVGARLYVLRANPGIVGEPDILYARRGDEQFALWKRKLNGENVEQEMASFNRNRGLNCDDWVWKLFGRTIKSEHELINDVCILNIVPYRSRNYDGKFAWRLHSAQLMKAVLHEDILPRARAGEIMLVCSLAASDWGVVNEPNSGSVIVVPPSQARGTKFGPSPRHGYSQAIRAFLDSTPPPRGEMTSPPT